MNASHDDLAIRMTELERSARTSRRIAVVATLVSAALVVAARSTPTVSISSSSIFSQDVSCAGR